MIINFDSWDLLNYYNEICWKNYTKFIINGTTTRTEKKKDLNNKFICKRNKATVNEDKYTVQWELYRLTDLNNKTQNRQISEVYNNLYHLPLG
jgi:hypothetical protein